MPKGGGGEGGGGGGRIGGGDGRLGLAVLKKSLKTSDLLFFS